MTTVLSNVTHRLKRYPEIGSVLCSAKSPQSTLKGCLYGHDTRNRQSKQLQQQLIRITYNLICFASNTTHNWMKVTTCYICRFQHTHTHQSLSSHFYMTHEYFVIHTRTMLTVVSIGDPHSPYPATNSLYFSNVWLPFYGLRTEKLNGDGSCYRTQFALFWVCHFCSRVPFPALILWKTLWLFFGC